MTNMETKAATRDTALHRHIHDMQVVALRLENVLGAIRALGQDSQYEDECLGLHEIAWGMARELNNGLDSVNLPDVAA